MQGIVDIYGPFGSDVIAEVQSQMQSHGSLRPLLKALNVPSLPGLDEQHKALVAFLHQFGITVFLHAVREKANPSEVERLKLARRESWHLFSREGAAGEVPPPQKKPDATGARKPPPTLQKVIITPTYKGPDRRLVPDRRHSSGDRRAALEVTFHNRRFGGHDRRHVIRRTTDRH